MAKTEFALMQWTAAESWRSIRSTRSTPPAGLTSILRGQRLDVFHMALEQAQELYYAASKAGYETRPLLLFYGLSQAGRAIAAASNELGLRSHRGTEAAVVYGTSHGLEFSTNVPNASSLWDTRVFTKHGETDSFSRVCIALGSPTDLGGVQLGALASQLLDFVYEFPHFEGWPKAFIPTTTLRNHLSGDSLLELTAFKGAPTLDEIAAYVAQYPALAKCLVSEAAPGEAALSANGSPLLKIPGSSVKPDWLRPRLRGETAYLGIDVILPALGEAQKATHPLLTWWMLLYSLSMLARYAPQQWARQLDLTKNPHASQIEFIQDAALTSVPRLLADALASLNDERITGPAGQSSTVSNGQQPPRKQE